MQIVYAILVVGACLGLVEFVRRRLQRLDSFGLRILHILRSEEFEFAHGDFGTKQWWSQSLWITVNGGNIHVNLRKEGGAVTPEGIVVRRGHRLYEPLCSVMRHAGGVWYRNQPQPDND
jgi:hypothetical protein